MEKLLEMNNFFKNIIIGLFSVRSNLTRVILTASGLTIGIFTVSIVSAAVSSIDKEFAKSMDYYGNDKVYVGTWPWSFDFDWWKYRNRPKIEESSLEYITQYSEYVTSNCSNSCIDADSLEAGIKSDSLQGGLYIGKNFLNNISTNQMGAVEIYYKSSDLMSKAKKRINNALDQYKNEVVAGRLLRFDIDKNLLEPLQIIDKDMSTKKETIGKALGGLVPYMLVIFIFLGAMYPAIDLGAGEKERGSLETLLSSPATKFEITVGKLMVVSLTGLVSGLISVVGITAPMYFIDNIPDQIKSTVLEIISPFMIISVIFLMIPIAIFFASMLLSISFYARSFKEAQSLMVSSLEKSTTKKI